MTELVTPGQDAFRYYEVDAHHLKRTLSLPTAACDHMPAVMCCEAARIPTKKNILATDTFQEEDRVGVLSTRSRVLSFSLRGKATGDANSYRSFQNVLAVFIVRTRATIYS
ncbi:hypothetical protein PsorP6_003839 [Peronosclerospora sorghi]|uniref:Uncharacterized protein n=1 Tax=Peronosclerospora sorghi TaxID=230839 RepID=A0ACC0VLI0_9STRA|nr:hypothetical protein PsorP6_003839 [Peronosclerospora sorghi]